MKGSGNYADNQAEIHRVLKEKWGWKCERCGHSHDRESGHVLTVHHLDGDKGNNAGWNLACLCQRCHLAIQGKVFLPQFFMFEHSEWFKPHVEGFYRSLGSALDFHTRITRMREVYQEGEEKVDRPTSSATATRQNDPPTDLTKGGL